MAKSGRLIRISRGGTPVVGARTDSVTINNEPLDVTDKDDAGWRTLLADAGLRSVSCSVEGVLKDDAIIAAAQAGSTLLIDAGVVAITGIATLSGDFHIQGVELGAEQSGVMTFTGTLESTGLISRTLAPYNTVLPAVTGTLAEGDTLTTTLGTWAGDATITYARQWQRGNSDNPNDPSWTNIAAATGETYQSFTADVGKYGRSRVTATNSVGSTVAFSNIVGPITA